MEEQENTKDHASQQPIPDHTATTNRINLVLGVFMVAYLHLLYMHIKTLNTTLHCTTCPYRAVLLLSLIDMLYLPALFYMFYKRMRWGWILLFGVKLFTVVPSLEFYFKDYLPHGGAYIFSPVLPGIIINIIALVLMWQQGVAHAFRLSNTAKWLTVAVVAAAYIAAVIF